MNCYFCGKIMNWQTKPSYVFDSETLATVGQAHATCANHGQSRWQRSASVKFGEEIARLRVYMRMEPYPEDGPLRWAKMLAYDCQDTERDDLNDRQREQLSWWHTGPLNLNEDTMERIVKAYTALLHVFRQKRAVGIRP